jgi:DNA-binding transcriptional LysR family regulator
MARWRGSLPYREWARKAVLARLALFHIAPDIEAGRLVPVLEDYNPGDRQDIHVVYLGQGGHLPARVRAFIDVLSDAARIDDPALSRIASGGWSLSSGTP